MSQAAEATDTTKRKLFLHTVEIDVSDEEHDARIRRLIEVEHKINDTESDKASRVSDFNGELKQLRKEKQKLLDAIKTKRERRDVECYELAEERTNTMHICRATDGKVLGERAMTLEDRMNLGKPKADAKAAQAATESPSDTGKGGGAANDKGKAKATSAGNVTRIRASDVKKKKAQRDAKEAADKARAAADANAAKNASAADNDDEDEDA
ncbi:MAG TPA: hypothetical protein VF014_14435 [Casimicrobiaceae bacterium]|nr:hypothetical protein [Casimicrobiaceae bacterium]